MKKKLIGLGLVLLGAFSSQAQNGLTSVTVEKYYISNAADAAAAAADGGSQLPIGSVTYRVYANLLPGYTVEAVYGNPSPVHALRFTTSTQFYNNSNGSYTPTWKENKINNSNQNVLGLDSWISVGGATTDAFGVLKSSDNGVTNLFTLGGNVLLNNNPAAGIPLTTQDGYYKQTPQSVTIVGISTDGSTPGDLGVLLDGSAQGDSVSTTNGSIASLNGSTGSTLAPSQVLLAQITTDGVFHYELNIQIGTPGGGTQNFVASNPQVGEISIPSLMGTLGVNPTVSITSPINGTQFVSGDVASIVASASEIDGGVIDSVEFFVDGARVGASYAAPYTYNYTTSATGSHSLTALAGDNNGNTTTSAPINITVNAPATPAVSITSPLNGALYTTGDNVIIDASASSSDGTITSVQFFVDGNSIGTVTVAPYTISYTAALGTHSLTAKATDSRSATNISSPISIVVNAPAPPTVNITSPANNSNYVTGDQITIDATATANDGGGSIVSVQFFVDGTSIGTVNSAPYSISYTAAAGSHALTAKATDDKGTHNTSSSVNITVTNEVLPVVNVTSPANNSNYVTGDIVAVTASASSSDPGGSITSVQFFVDGISIGTVNSAPYTVNYTGVLGTHALTAQATDNRGFQNTSATVNITVNDEVPPVVNITSPAPFSQFSSPGVKITVNATATSADPGGSITSVQFYLDGSSIGTVTAAPYSANFMTDGKVGRHGLTVQATDNRGGVTTSLVDSIIIINHQPYKVTSEIQTCLNDSFCLPVTAVDTVKNVIGYDMVVNYDNSKVAPTGVITLDGNLINAQYISYTDSINPAAGTVAISVYMNGNAPANTFFTGTGDILCVEFKTNSGSFTASDAANFTVPTLQESYITGVLTKQVTPGTFTSVKDSAFDGSLKYWSDNHPIKYNAGNPGEYLITNIYGNNTACSSLSVAAVQPDTTGNFVYSIWNGQNININKDIKNTTSVQTVINGFDALLAERILINEASYKPSVYAMIASDVNLDGVVSAGDVSQILERAVLIEPEFEQAWNYSAQGVSDGQPSKDWLFINADTLNNSAYQTGGYSKSNVPKVSFCQGVPVVYNDCPVIGTETYTGVMLGDVDGNYSTYDASSNQFRMNGNDKIVLDLSKAIANGSNMDIPVSVVSQGTVNSLDLALQFNQASINYNSIVDNTNYLQTLAHFNTNDQTLRFTSYSLQDYQLNKSLVSVRFTMNGAQVNPTDFTSLTGMLNGQQVPVVIMGINGQQAPAANVDVTFYPNPAKDQLNVTVSENAIVQIMDVQGKLVYINANVSAYQNQVLNTQVLPNGVYLMKVYNDDFSTVKKIIVSK